MDNKRFKGKTVFDFCTDKNILSKVLNFDVSDIGEVSSYKNTVHPICAMDDIMTYADVANDGNLLREAYEYSQCLCDEYDKTAMSGIGNGFIID